MAINSIRTITHIYLWVIFEYWQWLYDVPVSWLTMWMRETQKMTATFCTSCWLTPAWTSASVLSTGTPKKNQTPGLDRFRLSRVYSQLLQYTVESGGGGGPPYSYPCSSQEPQHKSKNAIFLKKVFANVQWENKNPEVVFLTQLHPFRLINFNV